MSTFIGILLDISCSMRRKIGGNIASDERISAQSIFQIIDDFVKHDVSTDNLLFAIGVGAKNGPKIIDILWAIKMHQMQNTTQLTTENANLLSDVQTILSLLEHGGARPVRRWVKDKDIIKVVPNAMIKITLERLKRNGIPDSDFIRMFVEECLPVVCRDWIPRGFASALSFMVTTEKRDIEKVMDNATLLFRKVCHQSIFGFKDASEIIHGVAGDVQLTSKRTEELLKMIKPYIFGKTPLNEAIVQASRLFLHRSKTYRKLLFIVSDGKPTDKIDIADALKSLKKEEVKVVSCFISRESDVEPKRLYARQQDHWNEGAKYLFNISSTISTHIITRAIFIKRGWKIDIEDNETRLFLHVNHPTNIEDACNLAKDAVSSQDALSDLLVSVSLDIYINRNISSIMPHVQEGGTCYANASAAVLHLAMKRVLGRDGGYPDFKELRDDLIERFGGRGAVTLKVLETVCPMYRLHCRTIDFAGAAEAITAKRPVVATFRLTDDEWDTFSNFFEAKPKGILSKHDIDLSKRSSSALLTGHAVVLTSFNHKCLYLMNSWGDRWADMGFFRVKNAEVLDFKFIDVYWTLDDLLNSEKAYYAKYGSKTAGMLMESLKSLQRATYSCPHCKQKSSVTKFIGTMCKVQCPNCTGKFPVINGTEPVINGTEPVINGTEPVINGTGNILALNMYLTMLSV